MSPLYKGAGDKGKGSQQAQGWYRGKTGLVFFVFLTITLAAFVLVGIYLRSEKLQPNHMSNFVCRYVSSETTFNVTVKVNLMDGMNQEEAIEVASEVFNFSVGTPHALESVNVDENGIWTVQFTWGYEGEALGHWFEAIINPFNQTVVYNRCR